jgi:hypothetical protein
MVLLPNNVPKISGYLFKYQIKFYLDKRLAGKGAKLLGRNKKAWYPRSLPRGSRRAVKSG